MTRPWCCALAESEGYEEAHAEALASHAGAPAVQEATDGP